MKCHRLCNIQLVIACGLLYFITISVICIVKSNSCPNTIDNYPCNITNYISDFHSYCVSRRANFDGGGGWGESYYCDSGDPFGIVWNGTWIPMICIRWAGFYTQDHIDYCDRLTYTVYSLIAGISLFILWGGFIAWNNRRPYTISK